MANPFAAYLQLTTERERAAIARELHDDVGGVLAAAKIELDVIGRQIPAEANEVHHRLGRLASALDTGLAVERRLVERLRPSVLDHLGLYVALQWQVTEQCRRAGGRWEFVVRGVEPTYLPDAAVLVLRMVEDAVAHALSQGGSSAVEVEVQSIENCLEVQVRYDGVRETEGLESGDGRLRGWAASERAGSLGGECTVSPGPGEGSSMRLRIPLANLERSGGWAGGGAPSG
jgi:signal transduction histidine kinase